MTEIYLGRHPETVADIGDNNEKIIKGREVQSELSANGKIQAYFTAMHLKRKDITHVYYSPSTRTSDMIAVIKHFLGNDLSYVCTPLLHERDFGSISGLTYETVESSRLKMSKRRPEFLLTYATDFNTMSRAAGVEKEQIKAGESFDATADRAFEFMQNILIKHQFLDRIYIATHKAFSVFLAEAATLICQISSDPSYKEELHNSLEYRDFDINFAAYHHFSYYQSGHEIIGKILRANYDGHLLEIEQLKENPTRQQEIGQLVDQIIAMQKSQTSQQSS